VKEHGAEGIDVAGFCIGGRSRGVGGLGGKVGRGAQNLADRREVEAFAMGQPRETEIAHAGAAGRIEQYVRRL
jgi:hypothetical protein